MKAVVLTDEEWAIVLDLVGRGIDEGSVRAWTEKQVNAQHKAELVQEKLKSILSSQEDSQPC